MLRYTAPKQTVQWLLFIFRVLAYVKGGTFRNYIEKQKSEIDQI